MTVLGMRLHFPSFVESVALLIAIVIFGIVSWSGVALDIYTSRTGLIFFEGLTIGAFTASIGASIARYKWRAMLFLVLIQFVIFVLFGSYL